MKLTDNEIKKALECCSQNTEHDCNYCPYFVDDDITTTQCMCNLMKLTLTLIDRRDAEIEKLKEELNHSIGTDNTKKNGCFPFD